jgi:hypothetical protein
LVGASHGYGVGDVLRWDACFLECFVAGLDREVDADISKVLVEVYNGRWIWAWYKALLEVGYCCTSLDAGFLIDCKKLAEPVVCRELLGSA